jgi:hypothetical protein
MYPQGNGQNWGMPTPPPNHGWIVPASMGTAPNAGTGTPRQVSRSSV